MPFLKARSGETDKARIEHALDKSGFERTQREFVVNKSFKAFDFVDCSDHRARFRDLAIEIAPKYNSALSEVFPTWESYSLPKKEKAMLAKRYIATIVLLVGCVLLGPAFVRADTITTFNVDGVFRDPFSGTFSGTITVDVTTGTLTAVDITFPGSSAYNVIVASEPISSSTWAIFANTGDVNQKLELTFFTDPTGGSLVGFTGGSITGSISDCCDGLGGFITPLTSVTTPEPPLLALLVTGSLAVCGLGFARTRHRTDQA